MPNVLNFGGGGFVGTAYMLGSLLAFDHVLVVPEQGVGERRSFFDYADDANVPFKQLEFRVDEVIDSMPLSIKLGEDDAVSRVFDVAQGISGGSLLAWSMLGDAPLVQLIKTMLEFDIRVYFKPNTAEFKEFACYIPSVVKSVAYKTFDFVKNLLSEPIPKNKSAFFLRAYSKFLLDSSRIVKDALPSGLCSGDGLESYVYSLSQGKFGLPVSFGEIREKDKHLIIMAERLNYVGLLSDDADVHETVVYFGTEKYDDVSIAKAIRASCSLPLIVAPDIFYDPVLQRRVQLLDGGIAKTVGFRKIDELYPDVGLWAVFNPIVPQDYVMSNFVDACEQTVKKLVYNRKCALWDELSSNIKDKTVLFEADKNFSVSLMAWPDMKRAFWHGYWHGLETLARNYGDVYVKLDRVGLSLVPPSFLQKYIERNNARKRKYV